MLSINVSRELMLRSSANIRRPCKCLNALKVPHTLLTQQVYKPTEGVSSVAHQGQCELFTYNKEEHKVRQITENLPLHKIKEPSKRMPANKHMKKEQGKVKLVRRSKEINKVEQPCEDNKRCANVNKNLIEQEEEEEEEEQQQTDKTRENIYLLAYNEGNFHTGNPDNVLVSMGLHDKTKLPGVTPSEEDYRALIYDLLLFRRESLEGFLAALRTERELLETKINAYEKMIKQYSNIREEIRAILIANQSGQVERTSTALTNHDKSNYNNNNSTSSSLSTTTTTETYNNYDKHKRNICNR